MLEAILASLVLTGADVAEIRAAIHRDPEACRVERPANLAFLELVHIGGDVVQQVRLTDRQGKVWVAYYSMERQENGGWRTNGCHLVQPSRKISA